MKTAATSLTSLPQKKITTGLKRLQEAGITPERWLAMLDADPASMQRLVRYIRTGCPFLGTGVSYDAATVGRTLGFSCECSEPVPKANDGEIVVYYGGWSLGDLVGTGKVVNHLSSERETWKAEPGYYRVLLPVPDSNRKTWSQQAGDEDSMLVRQYDGWQPIPTPVGATALAVYLGISGEDLLKGNFARCDEALPDDRHAALCVDEGRVGVDSDYWGGCSSGRVYLGAARKS